MVLTEWAGYCHPPENVLKFLGQILILNHESPEEEWMACLEELEEYDGFLCNDTDEAVFPSKRWTFLHHAAMFKAPEGELH